jgi:two-component system cell cycle response regulator DivK
MRLGAEDGLDLARRLRADPATQAIPILALSADAMQHDVERVLEAGCNGHVAKPVVARELLGRIHALLEGAAVTDASGASAATSAGGPRA